MNAGRKIKGTLHWVDAKTAVPAEFRLYDYLLTEDGEGDFMERLNQDSLEILQGYLEPEILKAQSEDKFQLMRVGYFCADRRDFRPEHVVLNRIVGLKDTFAKAVKSKTTKNGEKNDSKNTLRAQPHGIPAYRGP